MCKLLDWCDHDALSNGKSVLLSIYYGIFRKHVAIMSVENEAKQTCNQISVFEGVAVFSS